LAIGGAPSGQAATQERLKRELAAFLAAIGAQRTVILFFDDLHWADASTIDALAYVAARFDTIRALVIVTYRPTDLMRAKHPFAALKLELEGRGACRELALAFLKPEDVERFLAAEFPGHDLPAELPRVIHARTEGNPLFMAGLLRYLRDRGVIARRADRWVMTEGLDAVEGDLPASVRSMIQHKIDRLGEEERRLLAAASVQGVDLHASVVAKALGLDAADAEERFEAVERLHGLVGGTSEPVDALTGGTLGPARSSCYIRPGPPLWWRSAWPSRGNC
jgi:predicted ATPase